VLLALALAPAGSKSSLLDRSTQGHLPCLRTLQAQPQDLSRPSSLISDAHLAAQDLRFARRVSAARLINTP
jgi:hypothetical protein